MIGDPLYDSITRRREAKRKAPAKPRPEGVALYRCDAVLDSDDYEVGTHAILSRCGLTAEDKPYRPIPRCHGMTMVITGYDWDRDVS